MTRNGAIARPYFDAWNARTFPRTGITLKMLENETGISDATLSRYRDDTTTVPGSAIQKLDAAFTKYGFPGFMAEVFGCLPGKDAPAAAQIVTRVADEPAQLDPAAGADLCWWVTHEGTLHSAALGHAPFARQYFGLPADTQADPRKFALEQMGWLAMTRFADGRLALDGRADRARPESVARLCAWLDQQSRRGCRSITGSLLGDELTLPEAIAGIEALQAPPAPASIWSAEQLAIAAVQDPDARRLWRAVHDAGIERAHLLETADRLSLLDRCSLFIIDGDDVVSAHVGRALRVDRGVVGRNVMSRRDIDYAQILKRHVLEARTGATVHRLQAGDGIGYSRIAFTQKTGPNRWQALNMSFGIAAPEPFILA